MSKMGGASRFIPARKDQPELLDQNVGSTSDARANLTEMWRINRYFGGIKALTSHLYPLLRQKTEPLRVVDIGTGTGEIGSLLARWARRNGLSISICALDIAERNLSIGRENANFGVRLLQADACALPFGADKVDYFISSLFLHHLSPEQVISVLRQTYNRARYGIVMSDLVRGYLPLLAFRFIQPVFARNYLTQHDGILSIKRAYTPNELRFLAQEAGIETAHVYSHFPWRMTFVAEKSRV